MLTILEYSDYLDSSEAAADPPFLLGPVYDIMLSDDIKLMRLDSSQNDDDRDSILHHHSTLSMRFTATAIVPLPVLMGGIVQVT